MAKRKNGFQQLDIQQAQPEPAYVEEDRTQIEPENPEQGKKKKKKKKGKGKAIFITLLVLAIGGGGFWGYYNYVAYPPMEERDEENAPLGAIRRLQGYITDKNWTTLDKEIGSESYLGQEESYANSDEQVLTFMNNVIGKVKLQPKKEKAIDIYGNPKIDPKTKDVVYVDSLVNKKDETITITHVDYKKIQFDTKEIQAYLKSKNVTVGQADYTNAVVPVFCEYMNNLKWDDIPLKETEHKPVIKGNKITAEEDASIDDLLFASEDFHDMLRRFDMAVNGGKEPVTQDWAKWSKLDKAKKEKEKEPTKYRSGYVMSRKWCGANYLQNTFVNELGEKQKVMAQSGDGSIERPASLGTSILTYVIKKQDKKDIAIPIRVELVSVLTGDECLADLAQKDSRNRGLNESSQTKYSSLKFKVTNLSKEKLTIKDNSSLADKEGNLSGRTGTMYGLKTQVTLNPGQSGEIDSWVASTELNRKYLIWGADFNKRSPIKYFGVFRGADVEQKEDKEE